MSKWGIWANDGMGWERVYWAGSFDTQEEADKFIVGDDSTEHSWDGQVESFELEEGEK